MKRVQFRHARAVLGALTITTLSGVAGRADDRPATPTEQAQTALHLLEGARYGEAIPAAQALVNTVPNDPLAYQIRGTIALYVGSISAAQQDFKAAAALDAGNPVTLYGLALGHLQTRRMDEAQAELTQVRQAAGLTPTEAADADTALAYLRYLHGDTDGARTLATSGDGVNDPMRQELVAMAAARTQPQGGMEALTAFLKTPSGVPRVREDDGLRPLFETATPIEPSVVEPSLQQMFQASLRDNKVQAARQARTGPHVSGTVTLRAPSGLGSQTAVVTFTIDGNLAGMVNTPPYQYAWQTANATNGRHAVQIEALDTAGNVLSTTTRQIDVMNANSAAPADAGLAGDPALEARVWNLLRLRPARKVAEWTLASLAEQQGDTTSVQAHRTVAAALDSDYKDARRVARQTFGGTSTRPMKAGKLDGLWQGNPSRKQVALTFDDGPNPQKTPALLDALDKAGAPATFFVVGARAEAAPDLVRRMAAMGDDVEDHSYTHPNMAQSAPAIAESEILRASVVIRALSGRQPRFFRPPGGQRNPVVYRLAGEYGQTVALWTIDALNYEEAGSPQGLTDFVMKHMQPGAIVLMHNGMDGTVAAIPSLVAALRAKGYKLVTLTQMTAPNGTVKSASLPK